MTRVERRPLLGRRRRRADGRPGALAALRLLAAVVLTGAAGLVLVAITPQAVGYSAHVVMSGSMVPRVHPGDVVLTEPESTTELRAGQVLLVADPARPGGLLLHRLVSFDAAGDLVTRGDANQSDDSVHVAPSAVQGVARLRVPWVGLPAVWRAEGRFGAIALAAGLLGGAALLVHPPRGGRATAGPPSAPRRTRPGSSAGPRPPITDAGVAPDTTGASRATGSTAEGRGSATSAGYVLPPVPRPAAGRRGAGPAGHRDGHRGDHSGCFDGGRFCGQPRR